MKRHVFETMGTVVSLALDDDIAGELIEEVKAVFSTWDRQFSLHNPQSELSRLAAGKISLTHSSERTRTVYEQSLEWRAQTGGLFTPHRPDGVIDVSGIVKALAIDEAGGLLDDAGVTRWVINCGGDVLERRAHTATTTVGITDPSKVGHILTAIVVGEPRRAVATSGTNERGNHIWGRSEGLTQATVIANDIVTADVIATACVAGGRAGLDDLTAALEIDALAVLNDGTVIATPGIRLADPAHTEPARTV